MKKQYQLLIIALIANSLSLVGNPIISLFFQPLPNTEKIAKKLTKPGKIAKHTINALTEHNTIVAGICATYAGYVAYSDLNGEIQFPRKHTKPAIKIIVTTHIEPISLFENTIQQLQLSPSVPSVMYSLTQSYDEENNEYNWHINQENIPSDHIIPTTALVIIAKPSNIVIPLEQYKATPSANLVLPPLYVKKGINVASNSAYFLTIRQFFKPVRSKEQRTPLRLTTHLLD